MGLHNRHETHPQSSHGGGQSSLVPQVMGSEPEFHDPNLTWPFGKIEGIERNDIRETAYEVFFISCRSSPGFGGGRNSQDHHRGRHYHGHGESNGPGSPGSPGYRRGNGVGMVTNSRIKRALGLRTLKRLPSKRVLVGGAPSSPSAAISFTVPGRSPRRPRTSAEIMRMQMRITEQSDNRLRKTLMRTLVGQTSRRAETIILPLELLRHLKPSEFYDIGEYQSWQKRQLKILEVGLILHPSTPLEQPNSHAVKFREIMMIHEDRPLDTGKNSETMKKLCNCILSLAWRGAHGDANDVCHWADGHPLNIHIYVVMLESVFDLKNTTVILDEVDELMELMKKTWSTLGINQSIHNLCFTWVLFQQYVITEQTEPDLLCATFTMLIEVGKCGDREGTYVKMLASSLSSIIAWSEKKLLDYHQAFRENSLGIMENLLPVALQARKILDESITATTIVARLEQGEYKKAMLQKYGDRVDYYIRSSLRNAFAKMAERMLITSIELGGENEVSEALINLAQGTEELALKEKENYSNILKRRYSVSAAIAAVVLHNCYGAVLERYLVGVTMLSTQVINVLHKAGRLEKILVQMVVQDTVECGDGGKSIVREMVPYEVDSIIVRLLRKWIDHKLRCARDCIQRSKETETWNPKSKAEPFAQSAIDLITTVKQIIEDIFEIPVGLSEELVQDLADGLERVIREYSSFVASCGTKQCYIPALPPLTRCNRDSRLFRLWKRAGSNVGMQELHQYMATIDTHHPRPTTSRGTQRLYIRLNTLHYVLFHVNSLDKILLFSPRRTSGKILHKSTSYFELARAAMQGSIQHVAEVAAYRLMFLDTNAIFYESLYALSVPNSRMRPVLRILKQNLSLLGAVVIDRAQPIAIKEVMKASFNAYLMVLLAGGNNRTYFRLDFEMINEDFNSLKWVFCTRGVGLICENEVSEEAEEVEGVIQLMGQSSEQLIEEFTTAASEKSSIWMNTAGRKLTMPPTTARWNRSDPNTILRVLCHRNERVANLFLKRTFQLPKRR